MTRIQFVTDEKGRKAGAGTTTLPVPLTSTLRD